MPGRFLVFWLKVSRFRIASLLMLFALAGGTQAQQPAGQIAPKGRITPAAQNAACHIIAVDARQNLAAAKENSTGQSFQFKANNPAAISSLKVGQIVYANFRTKQVSVDGKNVFGTILNIAAATPLGPRGAEGAGVRMPGSAGTSRKGATKGTTGTGAVGTGSVVRPGVTMGGFWVPLGQAAALSGNQLSIRTVVRSTHRDAKGRERAMYSEGAATVTLSINLPKQTGQKAGQKVGQKTLDSAMVMRNAVVPPHLGELIWVNRTRRQIQWLNFPFSMKQEDDLGDSHHLRTRLTVSLPPISPAPGKVTGVTDVWTHKAFGGFNGSVRVTIVDAGDNALYTISKGGDWHVVGEAESAVGGGDSGITRAWEASVPANLLVQAAKVKIQHGAEDTTWSDLFNDTLRLCEIVPCSTNGCPAVQSGPPSSTQPPDPCGSPPNPPGPQALQTKRKVRQASAEALSRVGGGY